MLLLNDIVYCRYSPGPTSDTISVPIVPESLRKQVLWQHHNLPSSGHLGAEKTQSHLCPEVYWPGMLADIEKYCRQCVVCQWCKLAIPQKAPPVFNTHRKAMGNDCSGCAGSSSIIPEQQVSSCYSRLLH